MYEDIQLQEVQKQRWILTIDNESQICESIYDALDELWALGFHATFRLPKEMEDVNPMDKCF
jgi:hypothetical protein